MSKLKNIIRQLSQSDFDEIFKLLIDNNAEKSALLLKYLREKQLSDNKIMLELNVNSNAYYTLRSRLNEKIEEYLLKVMETPKTDILKRVASVNDLFFTKRKAIITTTLKKLEQELIDFDMSNELILVYKSLKKLHIHSSEHYHYSQQYNRHVAYTLSLDKAEDLLSNYFKKYGNYILIGDDLLKFELDLLLKELKNVCNLYQSHRLFVYQSFVEIFHYLYVEVSSSFDFETRFDELDKLFDTYESDSIYYHLRLVIDFLKYEYYCTKNNFKKADKFYEEVNDKLSIFLTSFSFYTFPSTFLLSKLDKFNRINDHLLLFEESKSIFENFESDIDDFSNYVFYYIYLAMVAFYAGKFDVASKNLTKLLSNLVYKKHYNIQLEIKVLLAFQYCLLKDEELFTQLMSSIQRQIRTIGKEDCNHILLFCKIMKVSIIAGNEKQKIAKIKSYVSKLSFDSMASFSPLKYIVFDESLLIKLSSR